MDIFHFCTGWYLFSSGKFSLSKEMSRAVFISIIDLSVRQRQMAVASPNSFTRSFFTINTLPSCSFMYMTILDLPSHIVLNSFPIGCGFLFILILPFKFLSCDFAIPHWNILCFPVSLHPSNYCLQHAKIPKVFRYDHWLVATKDISNLFLLMTFPKFMTGNMPSSSVFQYILHSGIL